MKTLNDIQKLTEKLAKAIIKEITLDKDILEFKKAYNDKMITSSELVYLYSKSINEWI